jgi:crossover junction endodeoxyribonuclease RusA
VIITLPLPPTANLYWRVWRGRAVVSTEARAYKQAAALAAKAQGLRPIIDGEVAVVMRVFRPARRGDLDNRLKVLLDALRGVAYRDDSQVSALHATQAEDAKNPRVEVEVSRVDARPAPGKTRKLAAPGPVILSANWKPAPA